MSRQDVTSSVTAPSDRSEPPDAPEAAGTSQSRDVAGLPRWLLILAWSTGPAAAYALLSLLHAALVERILSVDVGFGRVLAFWVGCVYLALLGWGFLPPRPENWYTHRRVVLTVLGLGVVGAVVSGAFTALWLVAHWVPSVGGPVAGSLAVLVVAGVGVLWLAGRGERGPHPPRAQ